MGGAIGLASAWWLSRVDARRQAGARLRAAFAPELALVALGSTNVEEALKSAFPRYAAAIEEYRFYVPTGERAAYQKAWTDYHLVGGSVRFFDYYMGDGARALFEQRVNAILRFASV
jgi:hypothetical protein